MKCCGECTLSVGFSKQKFLSRATCKCLECGRLAPGSLEILKKKIENPVDKLPNYLEKT